MKLTTCSHSRIKSRGVWRVIIENSTTNPFKSKMWGIRKIKSLMKCPNHRLLIALGRPNLIISPRIRRKGPNFQNQRSQTLRKSSVIAKCSIKRWSMTAKKNMMLHQLLILNSSRRLQIVTMGTIWLCQGVVGQEANLTEGLLALRVIYKKLNIPKISTNRRIEES